MSPRAASTPSFPTPKKERARPVPLQEVGPEDIDPDTEPVSTANTLAPLQRRRGITEPPAKEENTIRDEDNLRLSSTSSPTEDTAEGTTDRSTGKERTEGSLEAAPSEEQPEAVKMSLQVVPWCHGLCHHPQLRNLQSL